MRTMEDLLGLREELIGMLGACEFPAAEPLWQLTDWCITMQSIIDIEHQILKIELLSQNQGSG